MVTKIKKQTKLEMGKALKLFIVLSLMFFLFLNILSSQTVSPLYFNFIDEKKAAAVSFLIKIKQLREFSALFSEYKNIYGPSLENEVFAEDRKRREDIQRLESLLEKNPKSRDILYSLYVLYKEDNNDKKAQEYLKRAKDIDPMIKN